MTIGPFLKNINSDWLSFYVVQIIRKKCYAQELQKSDFE